MADELTQIADDPAYEEFGYLTHADISQLNSSALDSQLHDVCAPILVVKAPPKT